MLVKSQVELLKLLPQIVTLADSEKNALGFWPEQQLLEAISRNRLRAIANGETLEGYLIYSGVYPHAKIQQIATTPAARKQGVAASLIRNLISELERMNFISVKAEIASDLNGALSFYIKQGFEKSHTRPGGKARNREIFVHVRELDTETLFSVSDQQKTGIDLGIRRRSTSDAPYYAFDLNVYFDLAKNRDQSENAGKIFGAALAHQIRLAVANEFVAELQRNKISTNDDPILELALRLPKIPAADEDELNSLALEVHDLVFGNKKTKSTTSEQAMSDARHLAHAALARASAFVTRDGKLLAARNQLLSVVGIDVIDIKELIDLLPTDKAEFVDQGAVGRGFEVKQIASLDLREYLTQVQTHQSVIEEFRPAPRYALVHK